MLCGLMAYVIRMPRRRRSQEEIEAIAQNAIDSYRRYERKRLFLFYSTIAVLSAVLVMLDMYLLRVA